MRKWGHDVVTARDLLVQQASDEEMLLKAKQEDRILITRDKDFGALVFLNEQACTGVVLLRMSPSNIEETHHELKRFLDEHKTDELQHAFCVIEPGRHRIRHLV